MFVTVAAATFLAFAPHDASAGHFSGATGGTGCTGGLNKADNANHGYWYNGLTQTDVDAIDWTRSANMDPTHINTQTASSLTAATDVNVLDDNYVDYCGLSWARPATSGIGVVGLVTCHSLVSGSNACQQHALRINTYFTNNTTTTNVRGLACHENGHTVGLGHREPHDSDGELVFTCMHQNYPKNANAYDSHDVDAINSHY